MVGDAVEDRDPNVGVRCRGARPFTQIRLGSTATTSSTVGG